MIRSMTGYGRGECEKYNRRFVVEIRSVNHRYVDVTVKLPRFAAVLEDNIRKFVSKAVLRGKLDVYISYETKGPSDVLVSFNEALADGYVKILESIRDRYSLKDEITTELISRFPDVITINKSVEGDREMTEIEETLMEALSASIEGLTAMKALEGHALKTDITDKLTVIAEMADAIMQRAPMVVENYRQKLKQRLSGALKDIQIDEGRLLTEIAVFADKSCIDEELTRLNSHIEQMGQILSQDGAIGKKMDFLVQEMNREINTIGSKAGDLEITRIVVELKSEVEKIREQIQNIE